MGFDERSDLRYSAFKTTEGDTRQGGCVGDMSISTQEWKVFTGKLVL